MHNQQYTHNIHTVEIKVCNVMIDVKNFFGQPVKNDMRANKNIRKTTNGQGDDYTTSCFLGYTYFKNFYKMVTVDLRK